MRAVHETGGTPGWGSAHHRRVTFNQTYAPSLRRSSSKPGLGPWWPVLQPQSVPGPWGATGPARGWSARPAGQRRQPAPVKRLRDLPVVVVAPWPRPTESGPPGRHCCQSVLSVTGSRHPRQLGQPAKGVRQVRRPWSTQDRALRWVTGQQNSQQGAQAGNVWHRVGGVSGQQPAKVGNGKPPNALFFVDRAAVIDPYHQDH